MARRPGTISPQEFDVNQLFSMIPPYLQPPGFQLSPDAATNMYALSRLMKPSYLAGLANTNFQFGAPKTGVASQATAAAAAPPFPTPPSFPTPDADVAGSGGMSLNDLTSKWFPQFSAARLGLRMAKASFMDPSTIDKAFAGKETAAEEAVRQANQRVNSAQTGVDQIMGSNPGLPMLPDVPFRGLAGIALPSLLSNLASAISGNERYGARFDQVLANEDQDRFATQQQNTMLQRQDMSQRRLEQINMRMQQLDHAQRELESQGEYQRSLELEKTLATLHAEADKIQATNAESLANAQMQNEATTRVMDTQMQAQARLMDSLLQAGVSIDKSGRVSFDHSKIAGANDKIGDMQKLMESWAQMGTQAQKGDKTARKLAAAQGLKTGVEIEAQSAKDVADVFERAAGLTTGRGGQDPNNWTDLNFIATVRKIAASRPDLRPGIETYVNEVTKYFDALNKSKK